MKGDERREMLESFSRGPALLIATVRRFPKKMWLYKPSADRWSIHETILHLADSEASSYIQCRSYIAEPGLSVYRFDAARWARSLGYFHQSTREALEIIRRLRQMTHRLLVALPDEVWAHTIDRPGEGSMSLEKWVERQEIHLRKHLGQMRTNYEVWSALNPPRKGSSAAMGYRSEPSVVSATSC